MARWLLVIREGLEWDRNWVPEAHSAPNKSAETRSLRFELADPQGRNTLSCLSINWGPSSNYSGPICTVWSAGLPKPGEEMEPDFTAVGRIAGEVGKQEALFVEETSSKEGHERRDQEECPV